MSACHFFFRLTQYRSLHSATKTFNNCMERVNDSFYSIRKLKSLFVTPRSTNGRFYCSLVSGVGVSNCIGSDDSFNVVPFIINIFLQIKEIQTFQVFAFILGLYLSDCCLKLLIKF